VSFLFIRCIGWAVKVGPELLKKVIRMKMRIDVWVLRLIHLMHRVCNSKEPAKNRRLVKLRLGVNRFSKTDCPRRQMKEES
jgi:hypothetical protein